jgi:hypothetical protein
MPFTVPASRKSEDANRFAFTIGEDAHTLPHLKYAPAGAIEHFENGRDLTGLIACADDEGTRNAIRALDSEQMDALMAAWQEASKLTPGESPASE